MYLRICSLIALRRSPFRFDATVFRRPAASVRFQIFLDCTATPKPHCLGSC
jgi:hypothetical protein